LPQELDTKSLANKPRAWRKTKLTEIFGLFAARGRSRKVAELSGNSATFLVHPGTGLIIREPVREIADWLSELVQKPRGGS
jgi:hypothetical protein